MRNAIFFYEVKFWLKSSVFYLLVCSFFLFSFLSMLGSGGYFDEPENSGSTVQLLNSPYSLSSVGFLFAKLLLFVVAVFAGFSLYKDYKDNAHALLYTFPISKSAYLFGKLCSVIFIIFLFILVTLSGIWFGEAVLGTDNPKIGQNNMLGYLVAFGLYLGPSSIIVGTFVFVAVGISRNIFTGFLVVICFALLQLILENVFFGHPELLALLEPFGQNAFHFATNDWGFKKQNSDTLPFNSIAIWNRVLWLFLAFASFGIFYRKFELEYHSMWPEKRSSPQEKTTAPSVYGHANTETGTHYNFSVMARFKSFIRLMFFDFRIIARSWIFPVLLVFGGITAFFIQLKVTNTGEFNLLPLTRLFLAAPLSFYSVIIVFSTFLFSGFLVRKAGQYKINLLVDVTPVMNWQLTLSKIGAVSLIQVVQIILFICIGLSIQVLNGYYNFELGLVFFHLLVLLFPVLLVWNITSHFVHALIPNLFIGLFVLICLWLGAQSLEQIGLETNLLKYATLPALEYSDFNGYGHQLVGYLLILFYWLLFSLILVFSLSIVWIRGSLTAVKERINLAKSRVKGKLPIVLTLLTVNFIWLGFEIYRFERLDKNASAASLNNTAFLEDYKKQWERFKDIPQPKITDVELWVDLYPDRKSFDAKGTYTLANQTDHNIDTVFIRTGFDEITEIDWNGRARLVKEDEKMNTYLYKLYGPLQPGERIEIRFSIENTPNTVFSKNSSVLKNGSYLQQDILPRLGYQFVECELPLTNPSVKANNYFHRDASYVNMRTLITTSGDQIAIAPGELVSEKKDGNRNFFEYRTPVPVKFNFSFHSAAYKIIEETYRDITLQLFYQNGHGLNADLMLEGLKASLDYNSKLFGCYPYNQIRIIEFPHTEESFSATLKSNNIPASEVLFNINSAQMEEKINLPFYVVAHELTHEWFGNQVMPADAEGANMLTESITEYITLSIYTEHFGEAAAKRFLNAQYRRYNRGRKKENGKEPPLSKVLSHQEYISYGKGAIALNELSKSIGKERFDSVLRDYLSKYSYESADYPTTSDFIELLKEKTSKDEHKLIEHWLRETNPI
ncbi:MAG TPA: M1 family aminopeptidase [Cryomorphaceae bacterium]|nr:M1 family aminopeptidase [Cryomorphaceae bacterium]